MAIQKFTCPPQSSAANQFSNNLVGVQLVTGGGLTQANFNFTTNITEKQNRTFNIGTFSDPINLESINIDSNIEAAEILANNYRVYPNYDLSVVTNFTIFGSLQKRFEVSIQKILNFFPAAIEVDAIYYDFTSGLTAENIIYSSVPNETEFTIDVTRIKNPFNIDYSVNSIINLQNREQQFSPIRDLTNRYRDYSLFVNGNEYPIIDLDPTTSLYSGNLKFIVTGQPFIGVSSTVDSIYIKPNTYYTEKGFSEDFDEVEKFLLNRLATPPFTATFNVPVETDSGVVSIQTFTLTWPKDGLWNLDIRTPLFTTYLEKLNEIAINFDSFKTLFLYYNRCEKRIILTTKINSYAKFNFNSNNHFFFCSFYYLG